MMYLQLLLKVKHHRSLPPAIGNVGFVQFGKNVTDVNAKEQHIYLTDTSKWHDLLLT